MLGIKKDQPGSARYGLVEDHPLGITTESLDEGVIAKIFLDLPAHHLAPHYQRSTGPLTTARPGITTEGSNPEILPSTASA